jgi:hypothetical protein
MDITKLSSLTWEQLDQIQDYVQQAKSQKREQMEHKAKKEILDLLDKKYPEINLTTLARDLLKHEKYQEEMRYIKENKSFLESCKKKQEGLNWGSEYFDLDIYLDRLRSISNAALVSDDTRLLWLTNDGGQKTSSVSGKELSSVLQETIKKLERLSTSEAHKDYEEYVLQLFKISQWSEEHLGISLIKGAFTVIIPYFSRHKNQENVDQSTLGKDDFKTKRCLE